jgi:hypothetical protein
MLDEKYLILVFNIFMRLAPENSVNFKNWGKWQKTSGVFVIRQDHFKPPAKASGISRRDHLN